jgi:hypothetical protein
MGVLIPIVLWCGLVTMWLVVPPRQLWQDRRRCRETAAVLASGPGSAPSPAPPEFPWRAAPSHYGDRQCTERVARGSGGHPETSFATAPCTTVFPSGRWCWSCR